MRYLSLTAAAAAAVLMAGLWAPPAQAQDWPWCADLAGTDGGGGTNCGFASRAQCMTYLSGIGGWCYPNPYIRGEAVPPRRDRRH
jgi:hypothetical protein